VTEGKYITQARATLTCDDRLVLTATAALGDRSGAKDALNDQWAQMPDVPPPEDCAASPHWGSSDSIGQRIDFRAASGFFGDTPPDRRRDPTGKLAFWLRPHDSGIAVDRILLALAADFVTPGIRNATGRSAGGNSLDNSIRYGRLVPTDWLLCEVHIESIADGVVHGSMLIFARTGELLASASQSMILRVRD
jgi:acyl-CoA thioesterase II